jgi:hypothetical protein
LKNSPEVCTGPRGRKNLFDGADYTHIAAAEETKFACARDLQTGVKIRTAIAPEPAAWHNRVRTKMATRTLESRQE